MKRSSIEEFIDGYNMVFYYKGLIYLTISFNCSLFPEAISITHPVRTHILGIILYTILYCKGQLGDRLIRLLNDNILFSLRRRLANKAPRWHLTIYRRWATQFIIVTAMIMMKVAFEISSIFCLIYIYIDKCFVEMWSKSCSTVYCPYADYRRI